MSTNLTDEEVTALAVAAHCAPDKEIMSALAPVVESILAAREAAVRAQITPHPVRVTLTDDERMLGQQHSPGVDARAHNGFTGLEMERLARHIRISSFSMLRRTRDGATAKAGEMFGWDADTRALAATVRAMIAGGDA